MIRDFFAGAARVFHGIGAFYGDKRAWKYTILPFAALASVYTLMFWGIFSAAAKFRVFIENWISEGPSWISWAASGTGGIIVFLSTVFVIFFLAVTVSVFYETAGGIFFDSLTEYYEKNKLGIQPVKLSFKEELIFFSESVFFGIVTVIVFIVFFIISIFVPVAGGVLMILVSGYMMGISYMVCSARNCRMRIGELFKKASQHAAAVTGFGVAVYLLLLIPFSALLIIPGFVLGGSELFHKILCDEK